MKERNTKQKGLIYEALKTLDHPTATEVYGYIHGEYPSVSRATVFRVLAGFVAAERAQELKVAGEEVRYDYNVAPHCHVRCRECGKVADIWSEKLMEIGKFAPKEVDGFSVEGFGLEFFGCCEACREEKA